MREVISLMHTSFEVDNDNPVKVSVSSDTELGAGFTLDQLARLVLQFVNGMGYSYVDDVVFVCGKDKEVNTGWN